MKERPVIRRPEAITVTYRRMKFGFEEKGFERYWHGGSPFRSLYWAQLSTAFEPGEKFFIDSARAFKGDLKDQALIDELQVFCKQEGHHTAQHLKFDRVNEEMGIDILGCRARYARALSKAREKLDPMEMLSVTVALEHYTAGFSEVYLTSPRLSEGADPSVHALWSWHAAEETEHKATCYDVYRELGGSHLKRRVMMPFAWLLITWISVLNTLVLLHKDRKLFDLRDVAGGFWYLFGFRGLISGMVPGFLSYMRGNFHPWKTDNSQDILTWQENNASYIQNLDQVKAASRAPSH